MKSIKLLNYKNRNLPPWWVLILFTFVIIIGANKSNADQFLSFNSIHTELVQTELDCLSEAMYHEGLIDGRTGMYLVGEVILNRVNDTTYEFKRLESVCAVVHQPSKSKNHWECAFSYFCDGKPEDVFDTKLNRKAFELAYELAYSMLNNMYQLNLTEGALYYTQVGVYRKWMENTEVTMAYMHHSFRKRKDQKEKLTVLSANFDRLPSYPPAVYEEEWRYLPKKWRSNYE